MADKFEKDEIKAAGLKGWFDDVAFDKHSNIYVGDILAAKHGSFRKKSSVE